MRPSRDANDANPKSRRRANTEEEAPEDVLARSEHTLLGRKGRSRYVRARNGPLPARASNPAAAFGNPLRWLIGQALWLVVNKMDVDEISVLDIIKLYKVYFVCLVAGLRFNQRFQKIISDLPPTRAGSRAPQPLGRSPGVEEPTLLIL